MRISSRDELSIRVLTRKISPPVAINSFPNPLFHFVTLMSKRSADYSGRPAKRVMRRKSAGTYPTFARATRALPYARSTNIPPETKYFDTVFSQTVASAQDWTGTEVPCVNYIQSDGTTVGAYTDSALIPSAIGLATVKSTAISTC